MEHNSEAHVKYLVRWSLFNLMLVALAGVLLRYKILFSLPVVHHKNLLHGHSHFAFSGWVTTAIFAILAGYVIKQKPALWKKYFRMFVLLQISSFGMLFTFPFQGYGLWSISFSTLSIVFSWIFSWHIWKDLNQTLPHSIVNRFIKASLIFYLISAIGAFFLAYLMMAKIHNQQWYIGSAYYFLHFQYNGWFSFAIFGFLFHLLNRLNIQTEEKKLNKIFWLLCISVFAGYFLSVLWMKVPAWVNVVAIMAAVLQLWGVMYIIQIISRHVKVIKQQISKPALILLLLSAIAFLIKILLQTFSTVPVLSNYAFAYRPVVVGYLHLVLLGFVTLFLLGYLIEEKFVTLSGKLTKAGTTIFVSGILLNELILMAQGIAAVKNTAIPFVNHQLFAAAIIMFTGIAMLRSGQRG